jgi:uncharacterized protein (DUF305 family)
MKLSRMPVIAAIALILAGCAGPTGAAVPADHNPADVTFAQGMIPHHRQAIEMSRLAADRAASPRVKELAARIEQAQDPEIEQLTGMLETWGAPAPAASGEPGMAGMDHGGSGPMSHPGTAGMMSDQQMRQIEQATGPEFDTLFLRMMVEHHRGAIEMAGVELAQGRNPQARTLAQNITDDQRAEIATMDGLLGSG